VGVGVCENWIGVCTWQRQSRWDLYQIGIRTLTRERTNSLPLQLFFNKRLHAAMTVQTFVRFKNWFQSQLQSTWVTYWPTAGRAGVTELPDVPDDFIVPHIHKKQVDAPDISLGHPDSRLIESRPTFFFFFIIGRFKNFVDKWARIFFLGVFSFN
jgi:hypothetical protein